MTNPGTDGPDHAELRTSLGAYALGHLPPDAAARVRDHVAACADCRRELTELRPAVDALVGLRDADRVAEAEPPPDLGERVTTRVAEVRRQDGRRDRRRYAGAGALAGGAVAAALVGGLTLVGGDDPAPQAKVPLEAVPVEVEQPGVTADADLIAHTWGVEVKLSASGFVRGETYRVVVLRRDGARSPAGEFIGTGSDPMVCNLNSSVLRPRAGGFEVRDATGRLVVSSRF